MMNKLRMWLLKKLGGTVCMAWIPTVEDSRIEYETYPVERVVAVTKCYSKDPMEIEIAKDMVACKIVCEMLREGKINFRLKESDTFTTAPYELIGEVCVVQREDEGRHEKQG